MQLDPRLGRAPSGHPERTGSDGPDAELAALRMANGTLRAENERLASLADANAQSARLQADRAANLLAWAARNEATLAGLHNSTFWHLTAPVRAGLRMIGGTPGRERRNPLRRAEWGETVRSASVLVKRTGRISGAPLRVLFLASSHLAGPQRRWRPKRRPLRPTPCSVAKSAAQPPKCLHPACSSSPN